MSSPNPELLKALHAMNSFSALQANYNMMANGNGGQELLSKITNPLIPPLNMNPMNFGLLKTPAPFNMDLFSKFDTLNHQNVSPASGTPNMIKERMNMLFSPFMNPLNRPQNIDDAEHASLVEKSKSLNSVMGFPQFNKNKTGRSMFKNFEGGFYYKRYFVLKITSAFYYFDFLKI